MFFLQDDLIGLRPLHVGDLDGDYVDWLNDAETCRGNSHHVFPHTREKAEAYIQSSQASDDRLVLAIVDLANDQHIGNIALQDICWISRSAEFAILLGSPDYRGKGIGLRAGQLLLNHGFTQLNLHRIHCGTYANNEGMQALALGLGMHECGRLSEAAYKDGRYIDVLLYEVLGRDFLSVDK